MRKTPSIHLVLVSALLACCNRPFYQHAVYSDPVYFDVPSYHATDSCLCDSLDYRSLWYYAFRPYYVSYYNYGYGAQGHSIFFSKYNCSGIKRGGFSRGHSVAS